MKYIQTIIPKVSTDQLENIKKSSLRAFVKTYYSENFQNKISVINEDLGIKVEFIGDGTKKTSFGAAMYLKKAATILILDKLIKYAKYSNWGDRKDNDKSTVIGYLNFKVKVFIDGKICHFAINIQVRNTGKFHYSLDENRY
ncbi:MAG: hypothetical protein WCP32_10355 [Bacteroidota bacterium]